MRRLLPALTALCLLLTGCAPSAAQARQEKKQYTATFLSLFDTVTTMIGYADSEADFQTAAQEIHDELLYYHQLFDIYEDYEGISNLKTVNDMAGVAPVEVDPVIVTFLADCKDYYDLTGGKVNVAMGSVLSLWHDARERGLKDPASARLPDENKLAAAAEHCDLSCVLLDEAASTVFITDPKVRLDVGAVAKGWACQKTARQAPAGMLLSVGGNVCATGAKENGDPWVVGIRDPKQADANLHTLYLTCGTVVTSGDYQRTYRVDGKAYHHIIDPETGMPSAYWSSVSVICEDSGLADALSTALFLLPLEEGRALAERAGAEVLWVCADGTEYETQGLRDLLRT